MDEIILDGALVTSTEILHKCLQAQLPLPEYYGCSLDALWDALSTYEKPLTLTIHKVDQLQKNLGEYGTKLVNILLALPKENSKIQLHLKG